MRSSSSKAYSIADVKVKNCYQSSLWGGITSEIHVSKTMSDPFALLASQPAQREICWVCKYKVYGCYSILFHCSPNITDNIYTK